MPDFIEDNDLELARKAAEELLQETIETMQPMENGAFISRYITHAEYQLFLDDILEEKHLDWKLHHWTTDRFPPGKALAALAGLVGWHAEGFCNWLSERSGQQFRLSIPTEIARYSIKPDNLGVWCGLDIREYSFEGLSEDNEQAIMARLRNLAGKPSGFSQPSNLVLYLAGYFSGLRNRELARALDLNDDFVRALIRYPYPGLDLAFALAEQSNFEQVASALEKKDYRTAASEAAKILQTALDEFTRRRATLLQPLVAAVLADEAKDEAAFQLAGLKYIMCYEEYAYIGLEMREQEEKVSLDKKKQDAIDLYFWARVQIERRNDPTFPVWEGLRVVREG